MTQGHSDGTDMFIDRYLLLRDELRILSKREWLLQEIHGVLLFVRIVLRNALTVLQMSRMIREMYQSD